MVAIIFTFVYLVSFGIHIIICYQEWKPKNVGELIDKIELFMWFPIVNTIAIIPVILYLGVEKIWKTFKLNTLWDKFRNIKLP